MSELGRVGQTENTVDSVAPTIKDNVTRISIDSQ